MTPPERSPPTRCTPAAPEMLAGRTGRCLGLAIGRRPGLHSHPCHRSKRVPSCVRHAEHAVLPLILTDPPDSAGASLSRAYGRSQPHTILSTQPIRPVAGRHASPRCPFPQRRCLGEEALDGVKTVAGGFPTTKHLSSRCSRPAHSTFCVLFYVTLLSPTAQQRLADRRHIRLGVELKLASPLAAILGFKTGDPWFFECTSPKEIRIW